ncbi:hypothetical protein [Croceimicrobium hydrocarbonivorans]|uniref:Uncharacterized protein n=1 Tax=Croceimicrobium hydrocarbonivorans TaxID=2761580 RepID=A0A7H0VH21_9FLAO|nr:hypothetical protein [Croceimicrobium hydrocarbonivorans]QNR25019.1 hypothetical protein H4K34_04010 [Croceimicrobium hydrocarbonivorans]
MIFSFLSFPYFGQAQLANDTISHWHLSIGDKLFRDYNQYSENKTLYLRMEDFKLSDSLSLLYFDDTPCSECKSEFWIEFIKGKEAYLMKRGAQNSGLKEELGTLVSVAFQLDRSNLRFYFRESEESKPVYLLELVLKNLASRDE